MISWIRIISLKLRSLFRGTPIRNELDEEIEFHLEMQTRQNIEGGMSPKEARAAAIREFGHVERIREDCKASWGVRVIEDLLMDLQNAFHQALQNQGHTLAIVLTLGICLGANTTAINLADKIVSPFDYTDSDRVVVIGKQYTKMDNNSVGPMSIVQYQFLKDNPQNFPEIGFIDDQEEFDMQDATGVRRITVDLISPEVWNITGVKPITGSLFSQETIDSENGLNIVLSERLARQLSDNLETVVGSMMRINGEPHRVTGIVPDSFQLMSAKSEAWMPRTFTSNELSPNSRNNHSWNAIAKLPNGISIEQTNQQLDAQYSAYLELYPGDKDDRERSGATFASIEANKMINDVFPTIGFAFTSMQFATLLVLIIGCLNVSGILVIKSFSKINDLATRKALGATTSRLVQQLTVEICFYFFLGGLASLIFLRVGFWAAKALYITEIPWIDDLELDLFSLGATAGIALTAALLTSILPIASILRRDLNEYVKDNGRTSTKSISSHRLQSFFIVAQVALSIILLVSSGVLAANLYDTLQKDIGVKTEGRVAFEIPQPEYRFGSDGDSYGSAVLPFQQRVLETLRSQPGVVSASATNRVPLSPYQSSHSNISMDHYEYQPNERHAIALRIVTLPGYFDTVGTRIVKGRDFADTDTFDTDRVVIVSQNLVDKYYQGHEPIDSTLNIWRQKLRIVGVAEDVQDKPFFMNYDGYTLYFPYTQTRMHRSYTTYVVHFKGNVSQQSEDIARILKAKYPELTVKTLPFDESYELATFAQRLPMIISVFFALLALFLSGLGLYGLVSYIVAQRTKEFGIRMAFGATPKRIQKMVLSSSSKLVGIGILSGLAVAIPLTIKINPLLPGINAANPANFILVVFFVFATCAAASLFPAHRATHIDVAHTLRA